MTTVSTYSLLWDILRWDKCWLCSGDYVGKKRQTWNNEPATFKIVWTFH